MSEDPDPKETPPAEDRRRLADLVKAGLGWVLGILAVAAIVLAVVGAIARS